METDYWQFLDTWFKNNNPDFDPELITIVLKNGTRYENMILWFFQHDDSNVFHLRNPRKGLNDKPWVLVLRDSVASIEF